MDGPLMDAKNMEIKTLYDNFQEAARSVDQGRITAPVGVGGVADRELVSRMWVSGMEYKSRFIAVWSAQNDDK